MPKFVLPGFGQEEVEAEGGKFSVYEGPLPPKNKRTRVKVKGLKIKINSAGNPMLKAIAEIDAPKGHPMHQYNGAVMFWNGNLTKQGAGYVNEFLQAIAGSATLGKKLAEAVWLGKHGGLNLAGDGKPKKDSDLAINAIGTIKFDPNKDRHAEVITAHSRVGKGERKGELDLAVGSWVLPKKVDTTPADEPVDEEDEDDSGVEEEDGVEVEQEEDGDLSDEDDAGDDDSEDEESEEDSDESEPEEDEDDGDGAIAKEPPF